jgi:hypothetical protein
VEKLEQSFRKTFGTSFVTNSIPQSHFLEGEQKASARLDTHRTSSNLLVLHFLKGGAKCIEV